MKSVRYGTGLPPLIAFKTELLKILKGFQGGRPPKDIYPFIGEALKLSPEQRSIMHERGKTEPAFHTITRTARKELVKSRHIHRYPRDHWRLTETGRAVAELAELPTDERERRVAEALGL